MEEEEIKLMVSVDVKRYVYFTEKRRRLYCIINIFIDNHRLALTTLQAKFVGLLSVLAKALFCSLFLKMIFIFCYVDVPSCHISKICVYDRR